MYIYIIYISYIYRRIWTCIWLAWDSIIYVYIWYYIVELLSYIALYHATSLSFTTCTCIALIVAISTVFSPGHASRACPRMAWSRSSREFPAHGAASKFTSNGITWWLVEYPYISSTWKWNDSFNEHFSIESWKCTKMNALLVFAYIVSWNGLKCFCNPGDNLIICSNHVHWQKACDDSPFLQQVADPVSLVFETLDCFCHFCSQSFKLSTVNHWDHTVKHFWNAAVCVRWNFRECKCHSTISDKPS